jgi:glutamate-1-semialdehyde aminotransferase
MNTDVAAARRAHEALVQALRAQETAERNAVLRFADVYHGHLFRPLG